MLRLGSGICTLFALLTTARAELPVWEIATPEPVEQILATDGGFFVRTASGSFRLRACDEPAGICIEAAALTGLPKPAPKGGLPDGKIAVSATGDIRRAWYASPTDRYAHGVLGDAIEGGSLSVVDGAGQHYEFRLPEAQVFEDITPRIADLDGDGTNEVIAIRSSQSGGAAIAVYALNGGRLVEKAASSENGRPNRWLNIAGLVPRPGGGLTIYGVRTPHIGGRLFSLSLEAGRVKEANDIAGDVTNHLIGSRELGLSTVGDLDGNGKPELVLPSQDRRRLRFPLSRRSDILLPGPIDKAIIALGGRLVTATADGRLLAIKP